MWLDINIIAILLQNLLWISANYLQANANKQFLINFSNFVSILLEWLIFDLNHMNQFLRMFYVNIYCWHNKTVLTVKFECSLLCGEHTHPTEFNRASSNRCTVYRFTWIVYWLCVYIVSDVYSLQADKKDLDFFCGY